MARHFKDWITAYTEYALDAFCPEKFHMWTGFSTLAGALERRVWTHRGTFDLYPNIYVLLVARPGVGKSASSGIGVSEMLRQLGNGNDAIHFLASQNSDASFAKQFEPYKVFHIKGQPHTHSSKFFYASEASNAIKEIVGGGEITAALTEFYDCPSYFKKTLMGYSVELKNVCCNMLAGCTFSYLKALVPEAQSGGGFASRLIYVVQDETMIRRPKWRAPGRQADVRERLLTDLRSIYELAGPFDPLPEFTEAYEEWFPKQDAETQALGSERMQHFLARKHTNIVKLAMLCSVSESNDLVLRRRHWDRALSLMEAVEIDLPKIVTQAIDSRTQRGLNYLILKALCDEGHNGVMEKADLLHALGKQGVEFGKVEQTLAMMHNSKMIRIEISGQGKFRCQLLVDAKDYL
jgi:hypothetical protein